MFFDRKIAVLGMGYVGLPLAVEFGKHYDVVGFDIDRKRVEELQSGQDSTLEVTSDTLGKAKGLSFTTDPQALAHCNFYVVTVPTPIDEAKRPNLLPLESACGTIGEVLKTGDTVVFESTVYPGCTEEVCVPILETVSGLTFNEDFYCGYSPERINPGDRVNTLTTITKITSGSTPEAAAFIDETYKSIISAGTWMASSIRVAEAAKVIENSQRDLNIAFVNELSMIFDRLGIDTMEVLEAAGSKWNFLPFRPGMVGGHCIGVDPYYLTHKAEEVGYNPQVILAGRRINDNMARYAARNVIRMMLRNNIDVTKARVGVLGLTFKENCPDIRNSKVLDLIMELKGWNVEVLLTDNWADPEAIRRDMGLELSEISEANQVDAVIVAVGHKEFREMSPKELRKLCRGETPVLGDLKAIYSATEARAEGFSVFRL